MRLVSVVVDAAEPARLGRFWADALGWAVTSEEPDGVRVAATDAPGWGDGGPPAFVFVPVDDPKVGKNRVHLDLTSSSLREQSATVERLEELGARRADIGQEDTPWVVMADPEGNELCVLDPREVYRDVGPVAAVIVDCADPVELSNFWIRASGWPVLRYNEQFAALRHVRTPTTWLELLAAPDPKAGKNRVHLDVAPRPGDDLDRAVERLERAGGRRIDIGQGDVPWVVMADPEGNELCVLPPR